MTDLINEVNFQEISSRGQEIYNSRKSDYEPLHNGKFLAIETDTDKVYLGDTSADALEQARQVHPGKVFYVVKIGSNVAETMAQAFAKIGKR